MGGSITTWYFRVFLVRSSSASMIIGGSDTINGVSGRFGYVLQYLRVFLVRSRSYSVIMGGSHPGDSGVMKLEWLLAVDKAGKKALAAALMFT